MGTFMIRIIHNVLEEKDLFLSKIRISLGCGVTLFMIGAVRYRDDLRICCTLPHR
jgi:hypothetical protein